MSKERMFGEEEEFTEEDHERFQKSLKAGGIVKVNDMWMNLRDYFAGQALASLSYDVWSVPQQAAQRAYIAADAMMEERKKRGEGEDVK